MNIEKEFKNNKIAEELNKNEQSKIVKDEPTVADKNLKKLYC